MRGRFYYLLQLEVFIEFNTHEDNLKKFWKMSSNICLRNADLFIKAVNNKCCLKVAPNGL
jgi:hypothetical protein